MLEALLETRFAPCPYCGHEQEWALDTSAGAQVFHEECDLCYALVEVHFYLDIQGNLVNFELKREMD